MSDPQTPTTGFERRSVNPSIGWLSLMAEIYAIRSGLYFSRRKKFDQALRPIAEGGGIIAYPDAIYHITQADLERAKAFLALLGESDA